MAAKKEPEEKKVADEVMEEPEEKKPEIPWDQRKVRVTLFKDNERYKDDVTVGVGGKTWRIKRGVPVEVPMYVWLIIKKSMAQDAKTAIMIQEEADSFKEKESHFAF